MFDWLFKEKVPQLDKNQSLTLVMPELKIGHAQAATLYLAYMKVNKEKYGYTDEMILDMLKNQTQLGFENMLRHQIRSYGLNSVSRENVDELLNYYYHRTTFYKAWNIIQNHIYKKTELPT